MAVTSFGLIFRGVPKQPVRPILGPVPCSACRSPVVWDGTDWLFARTNLLHRISTCPGARRTVGGR